MGLFLKGGGGVFEGGGGLFLKVGLFLRGGGLFLKGGVGLFWKGGGHDPEQTHHRIQKCMFNRYPSLVQEY